MSPKTIARPRRETLTPAHLVSGYAHRRICPSMWGSRFLVRLDSREFHKVERHAAGSALPVTADQSRGYFPETCRIPSGHGRQNDAIL